MKHLKNIVLSLAFGVAVLPSFAGGKSDRVVILHTNDTHSIIDPYFENDLGGVARRKALIDSVRSAEDNVILIDAGDVVQGSLYFTLFEGDVEQKVMNNLGYDIQILGNHEFDNGMEKLRDYLSGLNAELITTNYDLSKTDLNPLFKPYTIKKIGDKTIGFIGINVDPKGLIDSVKSVGVEYIDALEAANATATYLKKVYPRVDAVVAISHIGYDEAGTVSDTDLARNTKDIDIIIGGHSHTLVDPAAQNPRQSRFVNLSGDTVLVAQTGKYGANVGEIVIDFANGTTDYKIIPVTNRFDNRLDQNLVDMLAPYKAPVDSILTYKVGTAKSEFVKDPALLNWMADFVLRDSRKLTKEKIDLALVNVGGIRASMWPAGDVTKGRIMQTFPFDNYEVVLEISGSDLAATLDSIAAHGGNGVSANVEATINRAARRCDSVTVNGKPIDPNRTYRVATINYLAGGNDHMDGLKYGKIIARSDNFLYDDMIEAFEKGWLKKKKIVPDMTVRMHE